MQIKNKSKISAIAIILVLTISAILVALPATTAQQYDYRKTTYAYIGAIPNPIGVNQEVLLHIGITDQLPLNYLYWEGLTVTVTKPNDEVITLGPYKTDSTGGTGKVYVPTMVGTYRLQTHFPGQEMTRYGGGFDPWEGLIFHEPSDSPILELVVQEEQLPFYPGYSLPTEYWTRPIDAQMHEWSSIAGNWLESVRYLGPTASSTAPETGHILWAKPLEYQGGLAGAELGSHAFEEGDAYEGKFLNSVAINGILFYNQFSEIGGRDVEQEVVAVDLHTGEELWRRPLTSPDGAVHRLAFGQTFYWDSYNYHGVFPYLWATRGSTWHAFDVTTGRWLYTMENVPSGTNLYGPKGEIYRYTLDLDEAWMTLWNSSRVVSDAGSWGSEATGDTFDARDGIEWNKTIPTGLSGSVRGVLFEDRILGTDTPRADSPGYPEDVPLEMWCINLKPGEEGTLLWQEWWQQPPGDLAVGWALQQADIEEIVETGVFTLWAKETMVHYGFNVDTGDQIWGPTESEHYMNKYSARSQIRFGKLYSTGYGGVLYAYDLDTGNRLWTYEAYDPYNEILFGNNWPLIFAFFTADGKIQLFHMEHSPIDPKPRGAPHILLDAETGKEVWSLNMYGTRWGGHSLIADGIIVKVNRYDNRIYAIGKGPSATTVSIQNDVVTLGSSAMIKGTVMDISPGTEEYALRARFPHGVPAIADEDMSEWMEYVYLQQSRPADATGVTVKLEAIDPNNNYQDLGTATSDSYGNYGFSFEPEVPGQYLIMATFYGSGAYFGSTTTTYLTVDPAPDPYPTVTIPPYPGYEGPTAQEVAQNVLDNLPDDPTADDIAQEVLDQLPEYPEAPETPEYTTIDLIIIAAVIVVAALVVYNIYSDRKRR